MKKKLLSFIFAICLIIPCAFLLSACNKDDGKKAISVTISFAMDDDVNFGECWTIDNTTNTYTTTYLNGYKWYNHMFEVIATTENGDTKHLYEATESNPMGYKIATNMPDGDGRLPVGTYTYKLYIEDFDNGQYKTEACESETYTIIIEKEPITLVDYEWRYSSDSNYYTGDSLSVMLNLQAFWGNSSIDLEMAGITNFRLIEDETSTITATKAGKYTAKVEYDADTANFDYDNKLPEKTFNWSIEKVDYSSALDDLWNDISTFEKEYDKWYAITLLYGTYELNQNIHWQDNIRVVGFKVNGEEFYGDNALTVTKVGTYEVTPIISQSDKENYVAIDQESTEFIEKCTRTFTITKKKINASNLVWGGYIEPYNENMEQEVYFNVSDGSIDFEYITDLDNNITNKAKNAGKYTAKVKLIYDENLYEIVGEPTLEYEWEIKKAETLREAYWYLDSEANKSTTMYSGLDKTPEFYISGCTTVLKHYDSKGKELTGDIINIGKYKSVVTDISGYDKDNYELKLIGSTEFEWQINYRIDDIWEVEISDGTDYTSQYSHWHDKLETTVVHNGILTVDFNENCITPQNDFTFKFSTDGGNTFVTESEISINVSVPGTHIIMVMVECDNAELLEFVDSNSLNLTIIITEEE